jgi:hypothetical protein
MLQKGGNAGGVLRDAMDLGPAFLDHHAAHQYDWWIASSHVDPHVVR